AYKIFLKFNIKNRVIDTLLMLTILYDLDALYDKALECLQQAESGLEDNNNSMYSPIIAYNYGKIYQGLKDYTNAIKYYEECLQLSEFLQQKHQKVY
ncbi:tetratricopeptide repeat protein, partial [Bacillus thuringiensis]